MTSLGIDTGKAILSPLVDNAEDANIVDIWKGSRKNSVIGINKGSMDKNFGSYAQLEGYLNSLSPEDQVRLFAELGLASGEGLVLGLNDAYGVSHINVDNIEMLKEDLLDVYFHEISHNTTSNEALTDYMADSGSFTNWMQSMFMFNDSDVDVSYDGSVDNALFDYTKDKLRINNFK